MGKKMKPFDELSFSDNYMFTTVLEDKRNNCSVYNLRVPTF